MRQFIFIVLTSFFTLAANEEIKILEESSIPVVFTGDVSKYEYTDSEKIQFENEHGKVNVYLKRDKKFLYFAFEIPDPTISRGDDIVIMLDLGNKRLSKPQSNNIRAYVRRKSENSRMHQGSDGNWVNWYGEWEYKSSNYKIGWEVEARINLKALKYASKKQKYGFGLRIWDNEPRGKSNFPKTSDEMKPNTWATLVIE